MFEVEYVSARNTLCRQTRATFTGAHTLARILMRKGCSSVSVNDPAGKEVYYLNGQSKVKH